MSDSEFAWGKRSLQVRAELHPDLQKLADRVLALTPFDVSLTEGHRGQQAQSRALEIGATQLPWPRSAHNREPSWAVHIDPYPINYRNERLYYVLAGVVLTAARQLGMLDRVRWGGDWDQDLDLTPEDQSLNDLAHYELEREGLIREEREVAQVFDLKALFGGKSWYQSMTAWGLIVWVGIGAMLAQACADPTPMLSYDLCQTLHGWSDGIGTVLTFLGLRRAATA